MNTNWITASCPGCENSLEVQAAIMDYPGFKVLSVSPELQCTQCGKIFELTYYRKEFIAEEENHSVESSS